MIKLDNIEKSKKNYSLLMVYLVQENIFMIEKNIFANIDY